MKAFSTEGNTEDLREFIKVALHISVEVTINITGEVQFMKLRDLNIIVVLTSILPILLSIL